ncbi:sensor domain-containing diguanylate cyclase [Hahella ganghwensis]|uniref:sensor domain-containing diguanylate cyclase n=1 Tax=Hahella ganghwensis TaxID=286420 RepID=UPI00037B67FE|nr:sensor domain-containing diguanylate cyclase [Hahella ganghwensis]
MADIALYIDSRRSSDELRGSLADILQEFDIRLHDCADIEDSLNYLEQHSCNGTNVFLALIGPAMENPLQTVRRIRKTSPEMHFVFLTRDENPALVAELQSPIAGVGSHWEVMMLTSEHFARNLSKALSAFLKRKKFRTTIAGLQNKIQESQKPKVSELQRYSVSLRYLAHIFDHAHDAIIATTCDGTIVKWNRAAHELFGVSTEHAFGQSVFQVAGEEWPARLEKLYKTITSSGPEHSENEIAFLGENQQQIYVSVTLSLIRDASGEAIGVSAFVRDVTEQKVTEQILEKMRRDLERMSYEDGLTGVANRRMFDTTIEREWRRMKRNNLPLSLILMDIDYFKKYNDHYGHQMGDHCLQKVAKALRQVVSRSSDVVARYGGEEFAILLPEMDKREAQEMAERCCQAVRGLNISHDASSTERYVTISAGLSSMIPDSDRYEDLLRQADHMLYKAKELGRNQVYSGTI